MRCTAPMKAPSPPPTIPSRMRPPALSSDRPSIAIAHSFFSEIAEFEPFSRQGEGAEAEKSRTIGLPADALNRDVLRRQDLVLQGIHAGRSLIDTPCEGDRTLK